MSYRAALVIALFAVLSACGGSKKSSKSALSYGENAQAAYEDALVSFRKDDCLDAEPKFRQIRREFPYSRFAALAELRVADCLLKQKKWTEAITAYRQFIRFRPSHAQIPYAHFKVAQAYYDQIPSDWLLAPPSHERDEAATRDALEQIRRFLADFSDDERAPEAKKMMAKALRILARHELYVARFYLKRGAPQATIRRLETLLTSYRGSGVEPEAMLLLGNTYMKVGERTEARRAYRELVEQYPESDEAREAGSKLRRLGDPSG